MKFVKNEDGFSLLELVISLAVMSVMTGVVMLSTVPTVISTAHKANMRSDIAALSIGLQGWHMQNPDKEPSAFEWEQMKLDILEDKVDTDLMYLQNITFVKLENYYCVEASDEINNENFTAHYYGLTGKSIDGPCPLIPGPEEQW